MRSKSVTVFPRWRNIRNTAILQEKVRPHIMGTNKPSRSAFAPAKIAGAACLSLLIAGCARYDFSGIYEPVAPVLSLEQRKCCDSVLGLKPYLLEKNRYASIDINEEDAVLEFRTGKSFTEAVELPNVESTYYLQVDSVVDFRSLDLKPRAIYPMVTLLDDRLNAIATYDNEPIDLRRPVLGPKLVRILLTIEAGSSARYALIHTSQERTNQGLSTEPPFEVVDVGGFDTISYAQPTQSRHKIQFAETGLVNLLAYVREG